MICKLKRMNGKTWEHRNVKTTFSKRCKQQEQKVNVKTEHDIGFRDRKRGNVKEYKINNNG